jgi:hypothetical protein
MSRVVEVAAMVHNLIFNNIITNSSIFHQKHHDWWFDMGAFSIGGRTWNVGA